MLILDRLGKSGLKVSKVILGAMSYGDPKWQDWVLDEESSLPLLEHAYKVGINTWDTVCCPANRVPRTKTVSRVALTSGIRLISTPTVRASASLGRR